MTGRRQTHREIITAKTRPFTPSFFAEDVLKTFGSKNIRFLPLKVVCIGKNQTHYFLFVQKRNR